MNDGLSGESYDYSSTYAIDLIDIGTTWGVDYRRFVRSK